MSEIRPRWVCAIDPGKTTGIALCDTETGSFTALETQFDGTCEFMNTVADMHRDNLLLVAESFIITTHTSKNTQAPWSLELIGVARMLSRTKTGRELRLIAPATAKRFSTDARLRHAGFHTPGRGHANDAARHLLYVMATSGYLPATTLREMATIV